MLTDKKKQIITNILKARSDVAAAYLFGSQQKGNASEKSDIDIGVVLKDTGADLNRELELETRISKVVGQDADVRILSFDQSPVFLMQAAQGELLMGHDRQERVAFEIELAKIHDDVEQYFRIARHYLPTI